MAWSLVSPGVFCHFRLVRALLASLQLNRAYSACRRKALKPPGAAGARRPAAARPKPLPAAGPSPPEAPLSPGSRIALKAAKEAEAAELFEAPTLRRSTKQRVEEAEKVRQHMEQVMHHPSKLSVVSASAAQEFTQLVQRRDVHKQGLGISWRSLICRAW